MNTLIIFSLMTFVTGSMMLVLDHHYYHVATVALLEKKIQKDYEAEAQIAYELAMREKDTAGA